jgi:putative DNA methylase
LEIGRFHFSKNSAQLRPLNSVTTFHTRHLPHYERLGEPTFLTWRLCGSLPPNRSFTRVLTSGRAFVAMDRLLDNAGIGPLYLRRPEIAQMVADAIRYRDPGHYWLHSFAVMPNHVHLLITPRVPVSQVMHSLKRFTARRGNQILGLTGKPFWQDESYDRLVRTEQEFERIITYIEMNPVKAGIVTAPEQFLWSSARPIFNRPQATSLPYKTP